MDMIFGTWKAAVEVSGKLHSLAAVHLGNELVIHIM
jgi:hypothetical protein